MLPPTSFQRAAVQRTGRRVGDDLSDRDWIPQPAIEEDEPQPRRVVGRYHELVVLATAERLVDRGPIGHRQPGDLETHPTGVGQAMQVERQSVAEVHHRVGTGPARRDAFGQTRPGSAVRHHQRIVESRAPAAQP